jgi:TonB family protein
MKFAQQLLPLMTATLFCGTFTTLSSGQQVAAATAVAPPAVPAITEAVLLKSTPPLTEDALRARYVGKLIFLRGAYLGDDLTFDMNGKVNGSPQVGSFTLSAFEVRKVTLSKKKLEIEADRYGLHYFGALQGVEETKTYDRVKISKKPVHITIEREPIVIPKVKKDKKKKDEPTPQLTAAAQTSKTLYATAAAMPTPVVTTAAATSETSAAVGGISPAHSAMLMNKALDSVFADTMDPKMLTHLPDYWQDYFNSQNRHQVFMPADHNVKVLSEGMIAPRVLNTINPSSNEYAQQYGIAGMTLLRTVVDASGTPREVAIARPIGFGLDEKAVEAVKNSHFKPAMVNGQPVPVVIDMVVMFRIYSDGTKPGSVVNGPKESVLASSVAETDAPSVP